MLDLLPEPKGTDLPLPALWQELQQGHRLKHPSATFPGNLLLFPLTAPQLQLKDDCRPDIPVATLMRISSRPLLLSHIPLEDDPQPDLPSANHPPKPSLPLLLPLPDEQLMPEI